MIRPLTIVRDLSFNKLQGNIPDLRGLRKPQIMYALTQSLLHTHMAINIQ